MGSFSFSAGRRRARSRGNAFVLTTPYGYRRHRRRSVGVLPLVLGLGWGLGVLALGGLLAWHSGWIPFGYWWLTNTAPPQLSAAAPATPMRGDLPLNLTLTSGGRAVLIAATVDGAPLALPDEAAAGADQPTLPLVIHTASLSDGEHRLHVEAQDTSRRHNQGALDLRFSSDNTPPQLTLDAPEQAHAGYPLALRVTPNEAATLTATNGDQVLPLFAVGAPSPRSASSASDVATGAPPAAAPRASGAADDTAEVLLLAVPSLDPPKELSLHLAAKDAAGNEGTRDLTLPVTPLEQPRQVLIVPPALQSLATGPVATEEAEHVAELTRPVTERRQWSGAFTLPVPANTPQTTGFGERRDYSDGYVAFHSGYDLGAPLGAPVDAAASGTVAFTGQLKQRGNVIILDHGWGVYTLYAHLSQIGIQLGDTVEQGQPIGKVGSTGLSTGAHLHFEVRLRGQAVHPGAWMALTHSVP